VASFRKNISTSIQLMIDGTHLVDHCEIANAFANHFHSTYNSPSPVFFLSLPSSSSGSHSLSPTSDSDIFKSIARLKPSKSVGLDNIPGFVIKGCSDILVPVLKHIFNLSVSQQRFLALGKQAAVVPIYKKGNQSTTTDLDS
jgi:hypothetical protein